VEPFEIVREVPLSPEDAFARVTDWVRHGDHVPLTTIRLTDTGFVARTGLGPVGFDDPMDVAEWDPPRFCRLEKRGRVVRGWAEIIVEPLDLGSRITWRELARTRGVVGPLTRVEAALGRRLFARLLAGLTRT
jgi:hypothetical protein